VGPNSVIWLLPRRENGQPIHLTEGLDGPLSPDGRWFLYAGSRNRSVVIVQSMPPQAGGPGGPPQSRQISAADSGNAVWRADGKEIFYLAADGKVMAAPVESAENFFVRAHRRGSSKRSWRRALFGVTTSRVTASDFS
jgi:eukaryotic-like serine/threonine-protein kinase